MLRFKALGVSALEMPDLNSFVIVLAEEPDGSGKRLEIQRALEFDEQDRELGQDTYCVCTDQGATYYGGITSWEVAGDVLRIVLNTKAATALHVKDGFEIEVGVDAEALAQLKSSLQRILSAMNQGG